jgi:hypothetical protein
MRVLNSGNGEATARNRTYEPGYLPVLIREHTKRAIQRFRFSLNDRGRAEERRVADALITVALAHPELHPEVLDRISRLALEDGLLKPLAPLADAGTRAGGD